MLMPVRGALNEMDDSERKDDARTKSHESFCGQDALPVLWVQRFTALFAVRRSWAVQLDATAWSVA